MGYPPTFYHCDQDSIPHRKKQELITIILTTNPSVSFFAPQYLGKFIRPAGRDSPGEEGRKVA